LGQPIRAFRHIIHGHGSNRGSLRHRRGGVFARPPVLTAGEITIRASRTLERLLQNSRVPGVNRIRGRAAAGAAPPREGEPRASVVEPPVRPSDLQEDGRGKGRRPVGVIALASTATLRAAGRRRPRP
jgi:hypothetical protein